MVKLKTKAQATTYLRRILRGLPLALYREFRGREILAILESVQVNVQDVNLASHRLPRRIYSAFRTRPPRQPRKAELLACILHRGPSFVRDILDDVRQLDWGHLLIWYPRQVPPPAATASREEWMRWADTRYIPDLWPQPSIDDFTPAQRKFRSLVTNVEVIGTTPDAIKWTMDIDLNQDPHDIMDETTRRVAKESCFSLIRPQPRATESVDKRVPPRGASPEPRAPQQPTSPSPQRSARRRRHQHKRAGIAIDSPRNRPTAQSNAILEPAPEVWRPRLVIGSHPSRHGLGRAATEATTATAPAQVAKEAESQSTQSDGVKDEVGRAAIGKVAQKLLGLEQEMSQRLDVITKKLSDLEERIDRITNLEDGMERSRKRPRKDDVKDTFAETILELS